MDFYYFVIFLVFVFYVCSNTLGGKRHDLFIISTFLLLIIISGLRGYEVGGDLQHYLRNYSIIGRKSLNEIFCDREKYGCIFSLIYKIAYSINTSPTCLLFFTSIINLSFVAFFIKRFSCNPLLSIYIYITMAFYTNTFNSVRSSMTLGVGLFIMKYIIERKFWRFFIGYLIAIEIHLTFLPFILLYYIYTKRLTFKYIFFSISICFVISQVLSSHMSIIATLAYIYDPGAYENIGESYSGGYSLFALLSGMTMGFYILLKKKKVLTKENQLFIHCLVIASCVQAFATYYTVLMRVAMFFYIVVIILFPAAIKSIKTPLLKKSAYIITVLLFAIYFQMFVMTPSPAYNNSNYQNTIPYKTFWEK